MKFFGILMTLAVLGLAACGTDSSNPKTQGMADLNPPRKLVTVTGDKQIQLWWSSGNVEDGFKGYSVFAYKGTMASLLTALPTGTSLYPKSVNLATGSIPRCKDNNTIFTKFGFTTASDTDCSGGLLSSVIGGSTGLQLAATPVTNLVACYDPAAPTTKLGNDQISMLVSGTSLETKKCLVKAIKVNGTDENLINGATYTFFAVAVKGDSYDAMSWTSNFVEDTPSADVYSGTVTLPYGKSVFFPLAQTTAAITTPITTPTIDNCTAGVCALTGTNSESANGIYIGRDSTTGYKQRLFISTSTLGTTSIQLDNPVTPDGSLLTPPRHPGDKAIVYSAGAYLGKGERMDVKGNEVFDIAVGLAGGTSYHYGKIVITNVALATPTNNQSDITFNVTIIMQPAVDNVNYLY